MKKLIILLLPYVLLLSCTAGSTTTINNFTTESIETVMESENNSSTNIVESSDTIWILIPERNTNPYKLVNCEDLPEYRESTEYSVIYDDKTDNSYGMVVIENDSEYVSKKDTINE